MTEGEHKPVINHDMESSTKWNFDDFDPVWYVEAYPDVLGIGADPYLHFRDYGVAEARKENSGLSPLAQKSEDLQNGTMLALFDAHYYRTSNPDLDAVSNDTDLYNHYLAYGEKEGRFPNKFFDPMWYCQQNQDVHLSGVSALYHYVRWGAIELRDPAPTFDATFYSLKHAVGRCNPLLHYILIGLHLGLATRAESRLKDLLPSLTAQNSNLVWPAITVIIPAYKGLVETKNCIDSLLDDPDILNYNIMVINDCSPEPDLALYLSSIIHPSISLINNDQNLGFVRTTNLGIMKGDDSDVVFLNSDTVVPKNWLRRLAWHAYSREEIGTVSPISNNATICSYPAIGNNVLPLNQNLEIVDFVAQINNCGRSVVTPSNVGYCMYVKREVFKRIGLLDEILFGRGYGEEVDFCQRSIQAGFINIIAWDVFVLHIGEVSFGAFSEDRKSGQSALEKKYPDFLKDVRSFVKIDEALAFRFSITFGLFKILRKRIVLFVTHDLGGGVDHHIKQVGSYITDKIYLIVLSLSHSGIKIYIPQIDSHPGIDLPIHDLDELTSQLKLIGVERLHFHHWIGGFPWISRLLLGLGYPPYDVTIHDFFSVCPKINFISSPGRSFCGQPGEFICNSCLAEKPALHSEEILHWRLKHASLLNGADRVIVPSLDTQRRLSEYVSTRNMIVVPHESMKTLPSVFYTKKTKKTFLIGVLGVLSNNKGAELIMSLAEECRYEDIEFVCIGYFEYYKDNKPINIRVVGPYQNENLQHIIKEADVDAILFPARWPETYSYTLSEALASGLPIIAPNIGAFPERLRSRSMTWLYPFDASNQEIFSLLKYAENQIRSTGAYATLTKSIAQSPTFYRDDYLSSEPKNRQPCKQNTRMIAIIPELGDNGQPSPCSYIRTLLPFKRMGDYLSIEVVSTDLLALPSLRPDWVVLQRHAMRSLKELDMLSKYKNSSGSGLLYDLDDNLLQLNDDHIEHSLLSSKADLVKKSLQIADVVITSTEPLAQVVSPYCNDVRVLPNALDDQTWRTSSTKIIENIGPTRILYMGTATHQAELAFLSQVVEQTRRKLGSAVEFTLIGISSEREVPGWIRYHPDGRLGSTYPGFVQWLLSLPPWDIGLAPLMSSQFNESKSFIKVLDYAALGAMTIASDCSPYQTAEQQGLPVCLIANKTEKWVSMIEYFARNPIRLFTRRESSFNRLKSHHTLQSQDKRRAAFLSDIFPHR